MKRLFVPGVFDVFHVGHLNYLRSAAEYGDYVIVGVQDDREVLRCKGVNPVIPLMDRIAIIEALRFVDEVVSYTQVFQGPLFEGLEIDVFACGEEYGENDLYPEQKRTMQYCAEHNIEVHRIPRTDRISSTQIRGQLKSFWEARAKFKKDLTAGVTVLGSFQGDQEKVQKETEVEVQMVLDKVSHPADKSLLDLGCGDGRQLVGLCQHFGRIVGVDYAPSLLEVAQQRISAVGGTVELLEGDVSDYTTDEKFDVMLLSGIIPCLDDVQMENLLAHLGVMAKPATQVLVRSSVSLDKRINVINQFSQDLKERYTAYYRTVAGIQEEFRQHGWKCLNQNLLYQHRPDTAVWWFEFERIN